MTRASERRAKRRFRTYDAIDLEVLWNRLITVVDEAAYAIIRTSMSKVVVEGRDFGALLHDAVGRQLAADVSIASKTGTTSIAVQEVLRHIPAESLAPGDVVVTNNPWWIMGHLNDIAMVAPIFHKRRLVGFAETMAHMADIGGCLSAAAREVYEEGLIIPPLKAMERGRENPTFFAMLEANVRVPRQIAGDARALVAGCKVMGAKLGEFLDRHGMPDLRDLGRTILSRSQQAMRRAIAETIPDGTYRGESSVDGFDHPLHIRVAVTARGGTIDIDFEGSSPQSSLGINCTLVYTHVWSAYIIKCLASPRLPNNEGTFAPIRVRAPTGSVLNPTFPAPVKMKPSSGHYIPIAILNALADAIPNRILAESGNKFLVYLSGRDADDRAFSDLMFVMGGMGARADKDGLHCMSFPANSSNLPVEVLEQTIPVRVREKRLIADSGGPGRYRGGCGQEFVFESVSPRPLTVRAEHGKLSIQPQGLHGGCAGAAGGVLVNGRPVPDKVPIQLDRGDVMTLRVPGSGGMYPARERDPMRVRRDVENSIVSPEAALRDYGVKLTAPSVPAQEEIVHAAD
ncbi:MAG: hydantoinase B/oxoprolinase family protein [Pseudomonadota bacterium]